MSNHEQDNDWLSIEDLLWALGLEPKPDKADLSPKESFSDEAASLTEASSPLVGASDDEATPPLFDIGSSAALSSEFTPSPSPSVQNSDPTEFPNSKHHLLAAEEHSHQLASSHEEASSQQQPILSSDVTAQLPTHRSVSASAPSHEAVTAKKAAWTVLESPTNTNTPSNSNTNANQQSENISANKHASKNTGSQIATAFEATAEMPPIVFPDKSAKKNKTERESQDGEPAVHLHHESPQMIVHSEDGTMPTKAKSERLELLGKPEPAPIYIPKTTKLEQFFDKIKPRIATASPDSKESASADGEKVTLEESTFADVVDGEDGTDGEKVTTEKPASHFEQASNVASSRSRIFTCILIALAAICLIASLSLILTSFPSGNQEARDSDEAAASATSLCNTEWTTTYHYTTTDSGGTSYSTTEIAQFDTNGTLIDSVVVIECKGTDQAKAILSQAEKDYGDALRDSAVCDKTVLLRLDGGQDGLTREAYSKILMDTKDNCQVAIGK